MFASGFWGEQFRRPACNEAGCICFCQLGVFLNYSEFWGFSNNTFDRTWSGMKTCFVSSVAPCRDYGPHSSLLIAETQAAIRKKHTTICWRGSPK